MQNYLETARNIRREAIRAIIYCRVSTDKQEEDGQSLDYQEEQGRRYCEQQGYQVIAVLREVQSGYVHYSYRQKLAQARQMIRDGLADVIITWDLRRFSRNFVHSALIFEEIEAAGGRIESVSERIDDSLTGKLIRSILSWCAESERQKIVEYANRHWQTRLAAGLPVTSRPPYGWRWKDNEHTGFVIEREEAAVRQAIFKMFVDEDMSLRSIKRKLEADRIPSPSGLAHWSLTAIRGILIDERNIGILPICQWKSGISLNGKHKMVPTPERMKRIPGGIPCIVDEATYTHAQLKLKQNQVEKSRQRTGDGSHNEEFLLRAGYIYCGSCGSRMIMRAHSGQYACGTRFRDSHCPHRAAINAHIADTYTWDLCCKIFERSGILRDTLEQAIDEEIGKVKPGQIEKDIADLQEKMAEAYKERAALPPGSYFYNLITADLNSMDQKLQQMETELRAAAPIELQANHYKQRVLALIRFLDSYRGRYQEATYQEKRNALEILGVKVTIAPSTGHWKQGISPEQRISVEFAPRFALAEKTPQVFNMGNRPVHLDTEPLFVFCFDRTGVLSVTSRLA